MTDNEIIKALECFALNKDFDHNQCIGCAFEHKFCTANMSVDIAKPALSLITRQKAEIERLQKHNTEMARKHYQDGRAEAIKEFAERLKTKCTKSYYYDYKKCISVHENKVDIKDIDNLVKEMVGDV